MAQGSSTILVQPQSESVVIRLGNRHAMAPRSLLRSKISTPRLTNLEHAVSASILKRLKRLCAGWRNFAIQTETSWSFINERNDKARMTNAKASQNAKMTKVILECFSVIRISSFLRASSFVIRHSDH